MSTYNIYIGLCGWWLRNEVRILPTEGERLNEQLQVVRVTYTGNSKCADKHDMWKNYSMMVQITAPASAGVNTCNDINNNVIANMLVFMSCLYVIA